MLHNVCLEHKKALHLLNTEKFSAIKELIEQSRIFKSFSNVEELKRAVIERENQQSTGFGHGIAVAHGKIVGLKEIYVSMGLSRKGINYQSYDGEPVRILFIVVNSPEMQQEYLQTICCLTKILKDTAFRESIIRQTNFKQAAKLLFERFSETYYQAAC